MAENMQGDSFSRAREKFLKIVYNEMEIDGMFGRIKYGNMTFQFEDKSEEGQKAGRFSQSLHTLLSAQCFYLDWLPQRYPKPLIDSLKQRQVLARFVIHSFERPEFQLATMMWNVTDDILEDNKSREFDFR